MTRRVEQLSFTAGELDPQLLGRLDASRYYAGVALGRNVMVKPHGGLQRRPGFLHVADVPDAAEGWRLIPFAFNTQQVYLVVLTHGRFRVYRDGALMTDVGNCPWTGAQLPGIKFTQSADTLLLTHQGLPPQRILRGASDHDWTVGALPLVNLPTFDYGSGAEPVISEARGWPECAIFYQGRLYLAGLAARPATVLGSKVSSYFDFALGTGLDDEGLMLTVDSDQVNAIWHMAATRALHVFTSGSEYVLAGGQAGVITPETAQFQEQTRRGVARLTAPVEIDGALYFVQRGGRAVREHLYAEVEGAFSNTTVSLLSEHLIREPVDVCARKGASSDAGDHILLVNGDGAVACLTVVRSQEIWGWTQWDSPVGHVERIAALENGQVYWGMRTPNGWSLQIWQEGLYGDAGVVRAGATPSLVAGGLAHLEGLEVGVLIDGLTQPQQVVVDGAVQLTRAAKVELQVALPFPVTIRTLPLEPRDEGGSRIGRRSRPVRATFRVRDSAPFTCQGYAVGSRRFGAAPSSPLDAAPPRIYGDVTVEGLPGWDDLPALTIEQNAMAPLHLLALAVDLAP